MSSEGLHVAREKLSRKTLEMHYAIASRMQELEAVGHEEKSRNEHGL